jgi:hypothetical protein
MGGRQCLNREVSDDAHAATGWLAALGLLALVLGLAVYLTDRPVERTYFLPDDLTASVRPAGLFGMFGQWLPAFLHVYAFILLTVVVSASRDRQVIAVCAMWFVIDALFECGQHPAVASRLAALAPDWFQAIPVLENTASYFARGTFDPIDILFTALGAMAAYVTIRISRVQRRPACTH